MARALVEPLPTPEQGLGVPQPQCIGIPPLGVSSPDAATTSPSPKMILDRLLGAYSIANGIWKIVLVVRSAFEHECWGLLPVNGLLGALIGVIAAI
jgi:hypothetical protein